MTGMAIMPVTVGAKGSSDKNIITKAFLDNGSNSSLCTELLMKQLGINGQPVKTSLLTLDVGQHPHLQGVFLLSLNAEVGLLITSDVPKVLNPLDIKHSQDSGPYAVRMRTG